MNKKLKIFLTIAVVLGISAAVVLISLFDQITSFHQGNMTYDHFIFALQTKGGGAVIALILMTLIGGLSIVAVQKIVAAIRKTRSLGFFEKTWPYTVCFLLAAFFGAAGQIIKQVKTSDANKTAIARDLGGEVTYNTQEPLEKFIQDYVKDRPTPDLVLEDMDLLLADLMTGKMIKGEALEGARAKLESQIDAFDKEMDALVAFFEKLSDKKMIREQLEQFIKKTDGLQAHSEDETKKSVDDVYEALQGIANPRGLEIQRKMFNILSKMGLDMVELLKTEEGRVSFDAGSGGWTFSSPEVGHKYAAIVAMTSEINNLNAQVDALD